VLHGEGGCGGCGGCSGCSGCGSYTSYKFGLGVIVFSYRFFLAPLHLTHFFSPTFSTLSRQHTQQLHGVGFGRVVAYGVVFTPPTCTSNREGPLLIYCTRRLPLGGLVSGLCLLVCVCLLVFDLHEPSGVYSVAG
jgi:hypothetical protein